MEEPLTPREFLSRYNLPQLVRIHEAHRVSLDSTLSSDCSSLKRARSTINSLELSESSSGSCSSTSTMTSESLNCSDSSGIGRSSRHRQIPTKMPERNNNHHNYHLNQHRNHNNHLVNNNNHNGKHKRMTINGAIGLNKLTTSTSSPGIINFSSNNTNKKQSVKTICGINQLIKSSSDQTKQSVNCEELDLDQPFLLYKAYTSRQVIGYTVSPDSSFDSNYFKKVGPNLLIPEGYRGWFSLVNSKGHTAGYFNSIDEVGRAHVPYFLTRDAIRGYKAPRFAVLAETPTRVTSLIAVKGNSNYEPITIEGGTVLRFVGVYEDISAFILSNGKPKSSLRFKKNMPTPLEHGPRYAKCIRFGSVPGGEILFVPITETGRFYVMAKRSSELSYNHVYSFSQLLRFVKLPVTVQLVTGPRPRNYPNCDIFQPNLPTNFSAVLRLEEIRVRDVILGCTLRSQSVINGNNSDRSSALSSIRRTWRGGNRSAINKTEDKPTLLEFDLDSGFSFYRTFVERNGTLSSRKIPELVIQRIGYCDTEADSWRRQIKLAHDIVTKDSVINQQPTLPCYRKSRKSLFDSGVIPDSLPNCEIDKMASIGSRTSSGVSTVSRLSKIIQKFWSPLKKGSTVSGFRSKNDRDLDVVEFDDIDEEETNCGEEINCKKVNSNGIKENINQNRSKPIVADQHHYETLKKVDEVKYFTPKQKLTRKQTLDVIFTDIEVSSIDKNRAPLKSTIPTPSSEDEPAYSTIE